VVFDDLSERMYGGITLAELEEHAPLGQRAPYDAPPAAQPIGKPAPAAAGEHFVGDLTLLRARPLFSGPQVERVRELQFQRPEAVVELALEDADRRGIVSGDEVVVRSNGTSVALRARVSRALVRGTARIADEHAADLHAVVEVVKA
jgi:anaerobic selenocysteine-containing dehydrogenase